MKRCRTCSHLTAGKPSFCPSCGGSYDRRVCSKGHANPRSAIACGVCGSQDLSNPQPQRRFVLVAGFAILKAIMGSALLAGTILFALSFAAAIVRDPSDLFGRMLVGLGLGVLWLALVFLG
jgi:hypothetical protein